MDTFMDKLAQKFTAQEIIKANTAAETEELDRLKAQVEQYGACLNRMQELCGDMERSAASVQEKLDTADNSALKDEVRVSVEQQTQAAREEIGRLTDESVEKIRQIQQNTAALEALQRKLEGIQESVTELGKSVDMQDDLSKRLEEKSGDLMEFTHKEGVKIYRNVQASVQEETAKQADAVGESVKGLQKKLKAVQVVAVIGMAAALASLIGVALELAVMFNLF